jgi:heterodisulfide reductase subunit A-like polyferredoxin
MERGDTMSEIDSKLSRRKFVLVGSAIAAAPLLAKFAAVEANAASADSAAAITRGTKVYYIMDQCVGCQVCRVNCPAEAIRFGNCRNEIVQSKCIHCGTCCELCHVSNISVTIAA